MSLPKERKSTAVLEPPHIAVIASDTDAPGREGKRILRKRHSFIVQIKTKKNQMKLVAGIVLASLFYDVQRRRSGVGYRYQTYAPGGISDGKTKNNSDTNPS